MAVCVKRIQLCEKKSAKPEVSFPAELKMLGMFRWLVSAQDDAWAKNF